MKRTYIKPALAYEDFTMSSNISGNCEFQDVTLTRDTQGCGLLSSGMFVIFLDGICEGDNDEYIYVPHEEDEYNGVCYHAPTDTTNLFNS
jgi:hypothetical protein